MTKRDRTKECKKSYKNGSSWVCVHSWVFRWLFFLNALPHPSNVHQKKKNIIRNMKTTTTITYIMYLQPLILHYIMVLNDIYTPGLNNKDGPQNCHLFVSTIRFADHAFLGLVNILLFQSVWFCIVQHFFFSSKSVQLN